MVNKCWLLLQEIRGGRNQIQLGWIREGFMEEVTLKKRLNVSEERWNRERECRGGRTALVVWGREQIGNEGWHMAVEAIGRYTSKERQRSKCVRF